MTKKRMFCILCWRIGLHKLHFNPIKILCVRVCVCVCVWERERERERDWEMGIVKYTIFQSLTFNIIASFEKVSSVPLSKTRHHFSQLLSWYMRHSKLTLEKRSIHGCSLANSRIEWQLNPAHQYSTVVQVFRKMLVLQ